jgi:hypothetical protein
MANYCRAGIKSLRGTGIKPTSVSDPDPYVFGPPGSGSGSLIRGMDLDPDTAPDPDPSIAKQK